MTQTERLIWISGIGISAAGLALYAYHNSNTPKIVRVQSFPDKFVVFRQKNKESVLNDPNQEIIFSNGWRGKIKIEGDNVRGFIFDTKGAIRAQM